MIGPEVLKFGECLRPLGELEQSTKLGVVALDITPFRKDATASRRITCMDYCH
jgi:hypothetical protein